MTRKQKKELFRIILSISLFIILTILNNIININWILLFILYLIIYLIVALDVLIDAFINIFHGQIFDEKFLMVIATIGAFSLGIYNGVKGFKAEGFDEGCAVMIFYQVGEFFQKYAVNKSRKSIKELMDIRPDYANLENGERVLPEDVKIDDIILIRPGEKVPLDGIIIEGETSLDLKALTGESLPKNVKESDLILSGSVNIDSLIKVRVTKEFYDSTVNKILELVESSTSNKSKQEAFITRFAKYYTPTVCILALMLLIIPSIIFKNPSVWIYRALSFLVVSCPCALVISIPLSFFAGLGACSKNKVLVKGSNFLEMLDKSDCFIFDKTGTLTKGDFEITDVYPYNLKDKLIHLAAIAEKDSNHPIALSIKKAYGKKITENYQLTNISGMGVKAIGVDEILCGNYKLMEHFNIKCEDVEATGSICYIALNKEYLGYIVVADVLKDNAIDSLNKLGNVKKIMLTGDNYSVAKNIASKLNLTDFKAELLPNEKVEELNKILNEENLVCFIGDGINDAPALIKSDIGISMGGIGSDAAIEASDIVLMNDDLEGISIARKISKKTNSIVIENIIFAIGIKVIILILAALGITNMWIAVFGDVGVAVIAILNAMRAGKIKK